MENTQGASRKVILDQRALIFNNDGQILLVRDEGENWDLPGGVFSSGDNWREYIEDFVSEKLRLPIMTRNPIFASDFVDPENGDYIYMAVVSCLALNINFDDSEYAEVKWIDPKSVMEVEFVVYELRDAIHSFLTERLEFVNI